MNFPPFLFIEPQGPLTGAGFILCTSPPFYFAKVHKFRTQEEMNIVMQNMHDWNQAHIPGYRISIYNAVPLLPQQGEVKSRVKHTLINMANFYLHEKIKTNKPAFSRYEKK